MANELTELENEVSQLFFAVWRHAWNDSGYPYEGITIHPATESEPRWIEAYQAESELTFLLLLPDKAAGADAARKFGLQKARKMPGTVRVMVVSIEDEYIEGEDNG